MLELAGNWPWARLVHGELISYLEKFNPRAIIFDITFSEPDVFQPQSDAAFAHAIATSSVPIYLPIVIPDDGAGSLLSELPTVMGIQRTNQANLSAKLPIIAPKALPPELWRTGHINFTADADQIGRRASIYKTYAGWRIPSMASRVSNDLGTKPPAQSDIILNWYAAPFQNIPYHTLYLQSLSAESVPHFDLKNKIVLIGSTAPGLVDFRPTTLSTNTPGQEILATSLANLLHTDWLNQIHVTWSALLTILLITLSAIGSKQGLHPLLLGFSGIIASLLVIIIAYLLLNQNMQWQPFSALAIGWIAQLSYATESFIHEKKKRQHTVNMFNRFLDPHVVQELTKQTVIKDAEIGQNQEITVLFSDIRGFTSLSESQSPEKIVGLLNQYFNKQVEVIFEHQGTLDKFIGDAIMAFWGAPIVHQNHAAQAVAAALSMSDQLTEFQKTLDHPFEIGIGIHTGNAVVGFIGSNRRLDYTAIGDAVNVASRIEGQTKGVAQILVSETTRLACGDAFEFIDHGEFLVKGRLQPVHLFEPRRKQ
jgi:adenylate cyclase